MKKLRVELEIDVVDLPMDERKRHAEEMGVGVEDVPSLKSMDVHEVASVLDGIATEGVVSMLTEGSDVFANFVRCEVRKARWVKP